MSTTTTTPIDVREFDPLERLRTDPRMRQLLTMHWNEVCLRHDLFQLLPHEERYKALAAAGALLSIGAFAHEQLVGYSVNIVTPHIHYADVLMCHNDVLFVDPEWRGSSCGARLMAYTELKARSEGCGVILWHAKEGTPLDHILRKRNNYWLQELIYAKEL